MWKDLLALTGPSTSYISSNFSDKKSGMSQDPTSPSVVVSNLLGQDTVSHLPAFSSASFPDREAFCSKVFPGEFYYVHHHTFQFARADAILQLPNNDVVCRLTSMVPVGTDPVLSCPSLVASTVHVLPIDLLAQPVHIVPICMSDSSCIIEHRTKAPSIPLPTSVLVSKALTRLQTCICSISFSSSKSTTTLPSGTLTLRMHQV